MLKIYGATVKNSVAASGHPWLPPWILLFTTLSTVNRLHGMQAFNNHTKDKSCDILTIYTGRFKRYAHNLQLQRMSFGICNVDKYQFFRLLGYYATRGGLKLTFRDKLSIVSSRVRMSKPDPWTWDFKPRDNLEEWIIHFTRGGSPKSRVDRYSTWYFSELQPLLFHTLRMVLLGSEHLLQYTKTCYYNQNALKRKTTVNNVQATQQMSQDSDKPSVQHLSHLRHCRPIRIFKHGCGPQPEVPLITELTMTLPQTWRVQKKGGDTINST